MITVNYISCSLHAESILSGIVALVFESLSARLLAKVEAWVAGAVTRHQVN